MPACTRENRYGVFLNYDLTGICTLQVINFPIIFLFVSISYSLRTFQINILRDLITKTTEAKYDLVECSVFVLLLVS